MLHNKVFDGRIRNCCRNEIFLPIRWCCVPNSSPLNGKGSPSHNHYRCHYHYKYQHNIRIDLKSVIKKNVYELLKEKPRIKTNTYRSNWHISTWDSRDCVFGTFHDVMWRIQITAESGLCLLAKPLSMCIKTR